MPDISMCKNESCSIKEKCYRFMATPDPMWQSYSIFRQNSDQTCDFFLTIKPNLFDT
jgi:hypothetical protein